MNTRPKSKSKISIVKPYSTKSKKIRKKSPKIIDYDKVAQKYGNLLETSLNTSNSTQPQKALNSNNNIDESYYDYIIDNIYDKSKIENSKNNNDSYYFTFKQKPNTLNSNSNNTSGININKNKYKNKAPISIISNREEMNKYFNDKNNKNDNLNNISSIKNYNNMHNTFNKQIKKTKTLKTNLSYKNDNYNSNQFKKIEKVTNTNYKTNKSYNNIKLKEGNNKEIKEVKDIKVQNKPKRLNRINSQENNFSKKFNINNNNYYKIIRNSESIQVQGNESIKEEVLNINDNKKKDNNLNNNTNANINNKLKEKIMLLLNLCRKYAYKFNKLFPICESNISNDLKNQSFIELKNTIIQYNNMIFNQNITKIFQLDDNKNDFLNINLLNENEIEKLNIKINELSNQIKIFKKNELIYKENINNLSQKIEILNNELNDKENIIQELKNKMNIKTGKVKEFHGLGENNEDLNINKIKEINDSNRKNNSNNKNNINSYNKSNKHNNRDMIQIEEIKNNINNKLNLETDEDKPLNTEIEKLDQEIFNLKSKLKKIILK